MKPSLGLFTYSTLPRGSVVHTANLADALHDSGWDVTVYALDKNRGGFFRPLRARLRLVPAGPAPPTCAELVRRRVVELVTFLDERPPAHDVYHAQDCLTANALLDFDASRRSIAMVRTVHHVEAFDDPHLARCQERSIRQAALCLAVSDAAAGDVRAGFGVNAHRVTNGVSLERFGRADRSRVAAWARRLGPEAGPVLLSVGGVEERKNTVRVLRAFARVRERYHAAKLVLLGGATVLDHGAYRAEFDRALGGLSSATRSAVVELGVVADEDVPSLFHVASVLAFPSLHEGYGLAALEALAAGLPVVASKRPPFTEYLDDSCATLVNPLSEESIANGILRALECPTGVREEGRRRAATCSWDGVAAMHAEHYVRLGQQTAKDEWQAGAARQRSSDHA